MPLLVDPVVADELEMRTFVTLMAKESQQDGQETRWKPLDHQRPPAGDWRTWALIAGRGAGKTRAGSEWVLDQVASGRCRRIALVAPTAADARDVMVEGQSGILACAPPTLRPLYEPSKRRLTFPNGAIATTYSADEPARLRGPQHDGAWADELAAWNYPETWDMLLMGLRLGTDPRVVVTTTPRPTRLLRSILADQSTRITRASTYANRANLAPQFFDDIIRRYEGTRLGRQELQGELLEDVEGALWQHALIDQARWQHVCGEMCDPPCPSRHPELARVVVAIDPAVTSGEDSDETGIVVVGKGVDGHAYVLSDLSCRLSPDGWARRAVVAYHDARADRLIAEVNNGGDLVERVIRTVDAHVSYRAVHASRGKRTRAEPIAALYEQQRVHHVGSFPELEDQMCAFAPDTYDGSPDRVDALVWALTELMLNDKPRWTAA